MSHACVHEAPARTDTSTVVLGTPEGACLRVKRAPVTISAATLRNADCDAHACVPAIRNQFQAPTTQPPFADWGRREAEDIDEDEKQEQKPAAPKDRPTLKGCQVSCWLSFIGARPPH